MWKRQYDNIVSRLPITSERIIGIQVELSPSYFVNIIQSYLPSKNHTCEKFAEYIETLNDLVDSFMPRNVCLSTAIAIVSCS